MLVAPLANMGNSWLGSVLKLGKNNLGSWALVSILCSWPTLDCGLKLGKGLQQIGIASCGHQFIRPYRTLTEM